MKVKFKTIYGICIASTLCIGSILSSNTFAQSAPGAEARCERDCGNINDGLARHRCQVQVSRCKERADQRGSAYRQCRSSGKSVEQCKGSY